MCLPANGFHKSENSISLQWVLNVSISIISVFAGAGLSLQQENSHMDETSGLTEGRTDCFCLVISVEQNCVREGCHRETVMEILKMLSLQCLFSCGSI